MSKKVTSVEVKSAEKSSVVQGASEVVVPQASSAVPPSQGPLLVQQAQGAMPSAAKSQKPSISRKEEADAEEEQRIAQQAASDESAREEAASSSQATDNSLADAETNEQAVETSALDADSELSAEEKLTLAKLDQAAQGADVLSDLIANASQNAGLMFAQAAGTGSGAAVGGFSATSALVGVAVIGAAVAASDSDDTATGSAAVNTGSSSLTTLARSTTFTQVTPTFTDGVYTATSGNQLINLASTTFGAAPLSGVASIDGGVGTDALRYAVSTSVATSNLTLTGVEVVQVKNTTGTSFSADTAKFTGVQELWNWESGASSASGVTFSNVASTSTVVGAFNTNTGTTVTYAATATGGRSVTLVADTTKANSAFTVNDSALDVNSAITTINVSSNGAANTVNVLSGITGGAYVETLNLYGDRALELSNVSLAGVTSINASGMKEKFTLNAGTLQATNAVVTGGDNSADLLVAGVNSNAALRGSAIETANLTFNADATVSLSGTTGLSVVSITGGGATADASFSGIEAGTTFVASGSFSGNGTSTFAYRTLSDFSLGISSASTGSGTNAIALTNVRDAAINVSAASGAVSIAGGVSVGSSDATSNTVSITDSGAATTTVGAISSSQAKALTVNLSSSAAGALDVGAVTSASTLTANLATSGAGNLSVAAVTSASGLTANYSARTADISSTSLTAQSGNVTITTATSSGGDIATGGVTSSKGDVILTGSLGASGTATLASVTATHDGGEFLLGSAASKFSIADAGNLTISAIRTHQAISISNVTLAAGSSAATTKLTLGTLQSDTAGVSVTTSPGGAYSQLTIGAITAQGSIDVDFSAGIGGYASMVGGTATEGIAIDLSVGDFVPSSSATNRIVQAGSLTAGDGIDFIAEAGLNANIAIDTLIATTGHINAEITTGLGTSNTVTRLKADAGSVNVLAEVNASTTQSSSLAFSSLIAGTSGGSGGSVVLNSASVISDNAQLNLGAVSAVGNGGQIQVRNIAVGADGILSADSLTSSQNADVIVSLGERAQLNVLGAIESTAGSVNITTDSARAGTIIGLAYNTGSIKADAPSGTVTINVTAGAGGSLQIADTASITAGDDIVVSVGVGPTSATNTIGAIATSAAGDISLTTRVDSSSAVATALTVGNMVSGQGSIDLLGAGSIGSYGTLTVGSMTATYQDQTVQLGTAADTLSMASGASLGAGTGTDAIRAYGDIDVYITQAGGDATRSTFASLKGAVASQQGNVEINVVNAAGQSAQSFTGLEVTGAITAKNEIDIDFVGGASSSVSIASAASSEGAVELNVVLGQTTTAQGLKTGALSGAAGVDIDLALGLATVSSTGAVTSSLGDVTIDLAVGSLIAGATSVDGAQLTFGAVSTPEGSVLVHEASSIGNFSTVTFGGITATSTAGPSVGGEIEFGQRTAGSVLSGATYDFIDLGVDAVVTTGALQALGDVGLYFATKTGSTIQTNTAAGSATNITATEGSVIALVNGGGVLVNGNTQFLASSQAELRLARTDTAAGSITARNSVQVGFLGQDDSKVHLGNVTVTSGSAQFGGVVLDLDVGATNTTNANAILIGNINAEGDGTSGGLSNVVTINATASTGSLVKIATNHDATTAGHIRADQDIVIDLRVDNGANARASHYLAASSVSGASGDGDIVSNTGNVTLTAYVESALSETGQTRAETDLRVGDITAIGGSISITGGTTVESQGHLYLGDLASGVQGTGTSQNIYIGSSSDRVLLQTGGSLGNLRTTLLKSNTMFSEGSITAYFDMEDGARLELGSDSYGTSPEITARNGSVTIDVTAKNFIRGGDMLDETLSPPVKVAYVDSLVGAINIGDIRADETIDLDIRSADDRTPVSGYPSQVDSPWLRLGFMQASNIEIFYEAYGVGRSTTATGQPNFIQGQNIDSISGALGAEASSFTGVFVGDIDVTFTDALLYADYVKVNAGALTGTLNIVDTSATSSSIIGGTGNDQITLTSAYTTIVAGSGSDNVSITGAQTSDVNVGGGNNVVTIAGTTAYVTVVGGSGTDNVTVTGGTDVRVNLDSGASNSATITSNYTSVSSGSGNDTVVITGANTSPDAYVDVGGGTNNVTVGSGTDVTRATVSAGSGTDGITVTTDESTSSWASVNGGDGTNAVTVLSHVSTVLGGTGADTVVVTGTSSTNDTALVSVGGGTNDVTVSLVEGVTVSSGSNNDTIDFGTAVKNASITSGEGNDVITGGNSTNADNIYIDAAGGTNSVAVTGKVTSNVTVIGGSGADTITGSGGNVNVDAGSGANVVTITVGANLSGTVVSGTGTDTINASGGGTGLTIDAGTNNDSVTVNLTGSGSSVSVNAGDGNDTISATLAATGNGTVLGGAGNDTISLSEGSYTVDSGSGTNTITLDSLTNASRITLGGTDTLDASALTTVALNATVTAGTASILSGSAGDTIVVSGGVATINSGSGDDRVTVSSASGSSISAGAGSDTIIGGSGADTIVGGGDADDITSGGGVTTYRFLALTDSGTTTTMDTYRGVASGDIFDFSNSNLSAGATFVRAADASGVVTNAVTSATIASGVVTGFVTGDGTTVSAAASTAIDTLAEVVAAVAQTTALDEIALFTFSSNRYIYVDASTPMLMMLTGATPTSFTVTGEVLTIA